MYVYLRISADITYKYKYVCVCVCLLKWNIDVIDI